MKLPQLRAPGGSVVSDLEDVMLLLSVCLLVLVLFAVLGAAIGLGVRLFNLVAFG